MKYTIHLNQFLKKVEESNKVCPTHINLHLALFYLWNHHHFQSPITTTHIELMHMSKFNFKTTFHKCIKDLVNWKWIKYLPSKSIYKGSSFRLLPFSNSSKNGPRNGLNGSTNAITSIIIHCLSMKKPHIIARLFHNLRYCFLLYVYFIWIVFIFKYYSKHNCYD